MSIKCRGLGGAATVRELRDLAKEYAPTVLCVLETQLPKNRVEELARSLGYDNAFAVKSSGPGVVV
jgi:exonuclease III